MNKWYCDKCDFKSQKTNTIKLHKYSHRHNDLNKYKNLYNKFIFNNQIDGIVYINLNHRKERNKHIKNELELYNFNKDKIIRLDAIYNKDCGHLGCCESHIKAIEIAEKKNWNNLLIFEDDFIFSENPEYIINNLNNILDLEWDVFLLAGRNMKNAFKNNNKKTNNYKQTFSTTTTSSYIVKKHYYNTIKNKFLESKIELENEIKIHLEKMKNKKKFPNQWNSSSRNNSIMLQYTNSAIDQKWIQLQKKDKFFIFDPPLGTQNELFNGNFQGNDT